MLGVSLKHKEKSALLKLLGFLATRDDEVSKAERQFVLNMAHTYNVSSENALQKFSDEDLAEICSQFESDPSRRLALAKAIELAMADGDYVDDEWVGARELADKLGITELDVAELEDWVADGIEWRQKGRELLKTAEQ